MAKKKSKKTSADAVPRDRIQSSVMSLKNKATLESLKKSNEHQLKAIIYMAAMGFAKGEIAKQLNISAPRINAVFKSDSVKIQIEETQKKIFLKDPQKVFMGILPKAVRVAAEIMEDHGAKESVRLDAAFKFMDRALGRPTQKHEVEANSVKDILMAILDGQKKEKEIEAKFRKKQENGEDIVDAEIVTPETNEPKKDTIDQWVDDNLDARG